MGSSAFAVLATIAAGLLSLSLSPASVLVGATYTAKELRGEEKVEVQAIQDIFNYQLGPTREELKSASVQTSDFLPDLPAYGLAGPCGVSPNIIKTKITVKCPYFDELKMLGWKNATLKVTMMLPGHAANGRAAPWPVIYIYAGFSLPSWGYTRYANHLASWGYATVQYDPDPYWLTITPRGVESELFVNPVIEWALGPGAAAANTQLDVRRMGVTGHSLGGKQAVLALGYSKTGSKHAGPTNISAAFLLDAVDIRIVSHEAPFFYSNMGETFANITVPIGAMGMPLRDKCTPPGHSWDVVYPAARKGSWMFLVYKSSHVVWLAAEDPNGAKDTIVFDYATFMCGGIGFNSKEATIKYTLAAMTAWFDGGTIGDPGKAAGGVGDPNTPALQQQFLSWAENPAQEKWVWFGIKNSSRFD